MIDFENIKQVHCIGIGGIGLSGIADILISRGYTVTGSDMNQNDTVMRLMEEGAKIVLGHRAKNVEGADLVVYTAAIGSDNPEYLRAKELGIPCVSRAEMLGELMKGYETSIAVSGTHGKTTTTSMVSLILKNAGKDPTILVGGNLEEIGGNSSVGHSDYFITEACEYVDSFLQLKPKIEIILNIDSDHLDYFKDIDHIVRSFDEFAGLLPEDGLLFAYSANPFVRKVIKGRKNVITYGLDENSDYYADDLEFDEEGRPIFTVYHKGEALCRLHLAIPGEHNLLNALVSVACCYTLGVDTEVIVSTLEKFTGTQRRFDIMGETRSGMRIIDDYAHHPTEIRATLSAASKIHHDKLWCIFQPHTYTRTMALFHEFGEAFKDADFVVLAEIYAAREKNIHKLSSKSLVQEIKKDYPDKDVYFFDDFEDIASFVYNNASPEDLIITMGAGDVYKIGEMILEADAMTVQAKVRGKKIND
ncbi:MAG: UDP-N-acetylmuramate--L-alanine ligase [Firmicutes bacterium]|nr:UDP-N-acetylmuramate--L-alanine ligase [Bacillota bacterium]